MLYRIGVIVVFFALSCATCSSDGYQIRDESAGESSMLNYEYSNHYYKDELKREHFFLNVELNKPAIVSFKNVEYLPVERHAPLSGAALVHIRVNKSGTVLSYSVVKYAGGGLDSYLEKLVRNSKFKPVEQKEEPVACDFILKVIFRD